MLNQGNVYATVAVKDPAIIKDFYGDTLGLEIVSENPGGVTFESGNGKLFVYAAPSGGTNQATSASWEVDDVAAAVADLASKGVTFEHYDMEGVEWEGDVAVMGPMRVAWFKDPAGNTLMLGNAG